MTEENVQEPGIFGRYIQPYTDELFLLFRLGFATLVGLHGAQKAFLLWDFPADANPNGLGTLVDIAGWVELISAFLIGLGILTRLGAGAMMVTMIVAYFGVHAALSSVWPWPHLYPNPPDGGQCVRSARGRGDNPLVHPGGHNRPPWQPQVGNRAALLRQGASVGATRSPSPRSLAGTTVAS